MTSEQLELQKMIAETYERFDKECFYINTIPPFKKLRIKHKFPTKDFEYCRIIKHNSYSHEWWKDYIGLVFLAHLKFHVKGKIQYLYEAYPIKVSRHYNGQEHADIWLGKSIIGNCIEIISEDKAENYKQFSLY